VLTAEPRGGAKFSKYADERTQFMVVTRGDFLERFLVVHEPVRGESRISSISRLADAEDFAAVEVRMTDGTVDRIAVRTMPTDGPRTFAGPDGAEIVLKGSYLLTRTLPDGATTEQAG
jgi:hypothetical protein